MTHAVPRAVWVQMEAVGTCPAKHPAGHCPQMADHCHDVCVRPEGRCRCRWCPLQLYMCCAVLWQDTSGLAADVAAAVGALREAMDALTAEQAKRYVLPEAEKSQVGLGSRAAWDLAWGCTAARTACLIGWLAELLEQGTWSRNMRMCCRQLEASYRPTRV